MRVPSGSILVVDPEPERLRAAVAVLRHAFGPGAVQGSTAVRDAESWSACEAPVLLVTSTDTGGPAACALVESTRGRWGPVPVVLTRGLHTPFSVPVARLPAPVEPVQLREEAERRAPGAGSGIDRTLLSDVLRSHARAGRTGVLEVRAPTRVGRVFLERGCPVHADCGERSGAAALFEMLCWNSGAFVFRRGAAPARTLDGRLEELLARADAVA